MYGIKRNILDVLTRSKLSVFKGISRLLINKIKEFARKNGLTKIIVVNPLESMSPILNKYGFMVYETSDETEERKFMNPISGTYAYWTLDV